MLRKFTLENFKKSVESGLWEGRVERFDKEKLERIARGIVACFVLFAIYVWLGG